MNTPEQNTTPANQPAAPRLVHSFELARKGGEWLGAARRWIQSRFMNGSDVTWGSLDILKGSPVTVADVEDLAAYVAAAAINEHVSKAALEDARELRESEKDAERLKWAMDHPARFADLFESFKWGGRRCGEHAKSAVQTRLCADTVKARKCPGFTRLPVPGVMIDQRAND